MRRTGHALLIVAALGAALFALAHFSGTHERPGNDSTAMGEGVGLLIAVPAALVGSLLIAIARWGRRRASRRPAV